MASDPLGLDNTTGSGRVSAGPTSIGTEAPTGRLGAVLRALGQPGPVALGRHGPWVATTLEHARTVLTDPDTFDFPMDVSRRALVDKAEVQTTSTRSPHTITPPLTADAVALGTNVFAIELAAATAGLQPGAEIDAMVILREPVARATTAGVLPGLDEARRNRVADLVLAWVDALGPVIASTRSPGPWSRVRRAENRSRQRLEEALAGAGCPDPAATGTVLAAGIQVPIAAGAWLLVNLAENPEVAERVRTRPDLDRAVAWETVRLCPPTWITARLTTREVELGESRLPAGAVVLVSPLLLGRLETLAPGHDVGAAPLHLFDPLRWDQDRVRPGAWLPFGAGPHACPGRNLGLAQLTSVAGWAGGWTLVPVEPVRIDQSRGIFPRPSRLELLARPRTDGAAQPGPEGLLSPQDT